MKRQQGFTLLEVMVALSICAMAGIAAMQATGEHINHISSIEEQTYASWVAENQFVMMRAKGKQWNAKNGHSGEEQLADTTWYWRQTVVPTADPKFVKVTVDVYLEQKMEK